MTHFSIVLYLTIITIVKKHSRVMGCHHIKQNESELKINPHQNWALCSRDVAIWWCSKQENTTKIEDYYWLYLKINSSEFRQSNSFCLITSHISIFKVYQNIITLPEMPVFRKFAWFQEFILRYFCTKVQAKVHLNLPSRKANSELTIYCCIMLTSTLWHLRDNLTTVFLCSWCFLCIYTLLCIYTKDFVCD